MYASTHKMWRQLENGKCMDQSGKEAWEGGKSERKCSQRLADDLSENIFHIT